MCTVEVSDVVSRGITLAYVKGGVQYRYIGITRDAISISTYTTLQWPLGKNKLWDVVLENS